MIFVITAISIGTIGSDIAEIECGQVLQRGYNDAITKRDRVSGVTALSNVHTTGRDCA